MKKPASALETPAAPRLVKRLRRGCHPDIIFGFSAGNSSGEFRIEPVA
jgi:hypothetical protein